MNKDELKNIINTLQNWHDEFQDQIDISEDEDTPDDEKLSEEELTALEFKVESLEAAFGALEELL
jgi:hypothetical protein